ncbi:MAG: hypothetical protein AAF688_06030, partial [Bacteroidota bacterium]
INMKEIDNLFKKLEGQFDFEEPNGGHELRFLEKLSAQNQPRKKNTTSPIWRPLLAVAASVIICFGLFTALNTEEELEGLASVSPELSNTQSFFKTAIENELNVLKAERTPETEKLIEDALKQIELLEKDYENLKIDLKESGNDERVVYAMISNFQSRIDLLNNVMQEIENIKQMKLEPTTI